MAEGEGSGREAPDEDDLAALPRARPRRNPVVAVVVVALAGVLIYHLRAELRYALSSRAPDDLGDVRTLAERRRTLNDNMYVTVSGMPDRRNALAIEPRGEKVRQGFFRLLGAGSRVFVRALPTTGRVDPKDEWTGRLRRFDALPYAPSLRGWYREHVTAQRYLAPDAIKAALRGERSLKDRAGEPIALTDSTVLNVDVGFPEELVVSMPADKFPAATDAEHELERMGFKLAGRPVRTHKLEGTDWFDLVIRAPAAQRDKLLLDLEAKQIPVAAFEDRWSAPLTGLRDMGPMLSVAGREVPWPQVRAAGIEAPVVIADDAFVLTEGEEPGAFWWAPALAFLLVGFAGFNVWYLLRARRA
jgi:hypothetical protein